MATSNPYLTPERVLQQVSHWLSSPPWGYLGSSYGFDAAALLMRPLSSSMATDMETKMREDLPTVAALPVGAVGINGRKTGVDSLALEIEISGAVVRAWVEAGGVVRVSEV